MWSFLWNIAYAWGLNPIFWYCALGAHACIILFILFLLVKVCHSPFRVELPCTSPCSNWDCPGTTCTLVGELELGIGRYTGQPMHPKCWSVQYWPTNQNYSTLMEVGSWWSECCIWVEQVDLDCPGVCYLLRLLWPSQMVLTQQVHYPQMALEVERCHFQLLPWVHPSHPALG